MVTKKPVAVTKKPVAQTSSAASRESKLRTIAQAAGLNLERRGQGWQLVDAQTGTQVAANWTDADAGLTLDATEVALKG
jgi:hypothetical protein